jgi:hypothetical protein
VKLRKTLVGAICIECFAGCRRLNRHGHSAGRHHHGRQALQPRSRLFPAKRADALQRRRKKSGRQPDLFRGKLQSGDIVQVVVPAQNTGNDAVPNSGIDELTALQYVRVEGVTYSKQKFSLIGYMRFGTAPLNEDTNRKRPLWSIHRVRKIPKCGSSLFRVDTL